MTKTREIVTIRLDLVRFTTKPLARRLVRNEISKLEEAHHRNALKVSQIERERGHWTMAPYYLLDS